MKAFCFGLGFVNPGIYGDPVMLAIRVFLSESGFGSGCPVTEKLFAFSKLSAPV